MIARLTPYRIASGEIEPLIEEIVALARSSWPVKRTNRRAEFFFVNRSSGEGLSVVVGDDRTVTPVIDLGRQPSDRPEEYDVRLLQLGGPMDSGVVDALFGRVVRCDATARAQLSLDFEPPPASPDVWARALLVAPSGARVLAVAVASDFAALDESLRAFSAHSTAVADYDDVAYHFLDYRDAEGTLERSPATQAAAARQAARQRPLSASGRGRRSRPNAYPLRTWLPAGVRIGDAVDALPIPGGRSTASRRPPYAAVSSRASIVPSSVSRSTRSRGRGVSLRRSGRASSRALSTG